MTHKQQHWRSEARNLAPVPHQRRRSKTIGNDSWALIVRPALSYPMDGTPHRHQEEHGDSGSSARSAGFIVKLMATGRTVISDAMIVVGGLLFCVAVVVAVWSETLFVTPIAVPESLAKRGLSSQYLAERVTARMGEIGRDATRIPHEEITFNDSQPPDIQVPGSEVSYASTVHYLKKFAHRGDVTVHVGITELGSSYIAHVEIEGGPFGHREDTVKQSIGADMNDFINDIGDAAVRLAEPNIFASYRFSKDEASGCSGQSCKFEDVVAIYDGVLKIPTSGESAWALAGKGFILLTQGRVDETVTQSREALKMYPDFGLLHTNLAVAFERQHHCDEALHEFGVSAALEPHTAEMLRLWGDALLHADRDEDALEKWLVSKKCGWMEARGACQVHDRARFPWL